LCEVLFKNTLTPLINVLDSEHEFVLVGQSVRITRVQTLVSDSFDGKEPAKSIDRDKEVVWGAAL
jgi:L1 cell adhesion molecule like protein